MDSLIPVLSFMAFLLTPTVLDLLWPAKEEEKPVPIDPYYFDKRRPR